MRTRSAGGVVVFIAISGCLHTPTPSVAPQSAPVQASAARTFEAGVAILREAGMAVLNADARTGTIEATLDSIPRARFAKEGVADCGGAMGHALMPTRASYAVHVNGDTSQATIVVEAHWAFYSATHEDTHFDCGSTGKWETGFMQQVKARAESKH